MLWLVRLLDRVHAWLGSDEAAVWNAVIVFYLVLALLRVLGPRDGLPPFQYARF